MNVTSTAVSLTVDDVPSSAAFLARHLGFREAWRPTASPPWSARTRPV
ncbi:VOC family protein [Streptomyces incarnatus]